MTAALRRLARGASSDDQDDRLENAPSTVDKCLEELCKTVIALHSGEYNSVSGANTAGQAGQSLNYAMLAIWLPYPLPDHQAQTCLQ